MILMQLLRLNIFMIILYPFSLDLNKMSIRHGETILSIYKEILFLLSIKLWRESETVNLDTFLKSLKDRLIKLML
jgi:hypothetical protein